RRARPRAPPRPAPAPARARRREYLQRRPARLRAARTARGAEAAAPAARASQLRTDRLHEPFLELLGPRTVLPGLVGVARGRHQVLLEDLGHALGEFPIIDVEAG